MYWRLVKSRIDFEIALMRRWISLQRPWPSEGPPRHQPRSPAVALLAVHKWGQGTQTVVVWWLKICKLWAGILVPVSTSEVPSCILDLFSCCVCGMFSFHLHSPHPPQPNKYLQQKALGWFFHKSTRKGYRFLLAPQPTHVRATLRVTRYSVLSFVLLVRTDGGYWMRKDRIKLATCITVQNWGVEQPPPCLQDDYSHFLFPLKDEKSWYRFFKLSKAGPHSSSPYPAN